MWTFGPLWYRQNTILYQLFWRVLTIQLAETGSKVIALFEDSFAAAFDVGVEFAGEIAHAPAEVVEIEVDGWELGERAVAVGEGVAGILVGLRCAEVALRGAEVGCCCGSHLEYG